MRVLRSALPIIAALSLGFAAVQVPADEADQVRSTVVNYGDLDLARAESASALYLRLKHAAWRVCKRPDGAYGDPAVWLHCSHDALLRAVRDLGNARVTALYNGEHHEAIPAPTKVAAK